MSSVVYKGASREKPRRPIDPLSKRIPENPRYKNVKSTIDTGASLTKYLEKIEDLKTNYKFRKDEIFKRMKVTTCVQLATKKSFDEYGSWNVFLLQMRFNTCWYFNASCYFALIQVYRISQVEEEFDNASPRSDDDRPDTDMELRHIHDDRCPSPTLPDRDRDYGGRGEPESSRSTLLSVARGVGEMDIGKRGATSRDKDQTTNPSEINSCPYLLLDIRDKDEYDQCHIIPALSYSKAYLSRAVNYESKEMLQFIVCGKKNREGKIIIIYDEDERLATVAATTLVQRGYDNLLMLSGGLKVAAKVFPEGLITGTLPFSVTGHKAKDPRPASQRCFTDDDINKLEMYLDNSVKDTGSSRMSSKASVASSRQSTVTSTSSRASSMMTDRPAFKP